MSASGRLERARPSACERCLRRSWLLGALSGPLDYQCRDYARFMDVLALDEEELLAALAGRRRVELEDRLRDWDACELDRGADVEAICHHDPRYPATLRGASAPHMLFLHGGSARLQRLAGLPTVAILGARAPSDYGLEMSRSLARGLAAAGVTVVSRLADGIPGAAQSGVRDVQGASVAVLDGGLDVSPPARLAAVLAHVREVGCVVAELPRGCSGRRFGAVAAERVVAELAAVVLMVEGRAGAADLAAATTARSRGRIVAAVPGRATSALAAGPLSLLREGAVLVRGPEDVLELLDSDSARAPSAPATNDASPRSLPPRLAGLLERVGAGCDTAERLCREGPDAAAVLLGLSELELMGLLSRGHGGRYVPRAHC
jgi:DNA processing protein